MNKIQTQKYPLNYLKQTVMLTKTDQRKDSRQIDLSVYYLSDQLNMQMVKVLKYGGHSFFILKQNLFCVQMTAFQYLLFWIVSQLFLQFISLIFPSCHHPFSEREISDLMKFFPIICNHPQFYSFLGRYKRLFQHFHDQ